MSALEGISAFNALASMLSGGPRNWNAASPSIERLRVALLAQRSSALDLAVLLRQALRREHSRRGYSVSPSVLVTDSRLATFEDWPSVGLEFSSSPEGPLVSALPWRPDWLKSQGEEGVDGRAASETVCREFNGVNASGDPFLQSVGRVSYRSPGQRAAVRAALSTPPGGTLVSLCRPVKAKA